MFRLRYVAETPIPDEFEIYFYDEVAKVINGEVIVEKEYNKDRLLKLGFELIEEKDNSEKEAKKVKKK